MQLLIDANVVVRYYFLSVLEQAHGLTENPEFIFTRLDNTQDTLFLDEGGQILQDWLERGQIEQEWFDAWYPTLLIEGKAFEISVKPCPQLINRLVQKCGFRREGRDKHYIRTAMAVVKAHDQVILVTEDIDLHQPREKNNCKEARRLEILTRRSGNMVKELRKQKIDIHCVASYKSMLDDA